MHKKILLLLAISLTICTGCGKEQPENAPAENEIQTEENSQTEDVPGEEVTEEPAKANEEMNYEEFQELTPEEQQKHMESFDNVEEFFEWYNKEKDLYEEENSPIEISGDVIDLEEVLDKDE